MEHGNILGQTITKPETVRETSPEETERRENLNGKSDEKTEGNKCEERDQGSSSKEEISGETTAPQDVLLNETKVSRTTTNIDILEDDSTDKKQTDIDQDVMSKELVSEDIITASGALHADSVQDSNIVQRKVDSETVEKLKCGTSIEVELNIQKKDIEQKLIQTVGGVKSTNIHSGHGKDQSDINTECSVEEGSQSHDENKKSPRKSDVDRNIFSLLGNELNKSVSKNEVLDKSEEKSVLDNSRAINEGNQASGKTISSLVKDSQEKKTGNARDIRNQKIEKSSEDEKLLPDKKETNSYNKKEFLSKLEFNLQSDLGTEHNQKKFIGTVERSQDGTCDGTKTTEPVCTELIDKGETRDICVNSEFLDKGHKLSDVSDSNNSAIDVEKLEQNLKLEKESPTANEKESENSISSRSVRDSDSLQSDRECEIRQPATSAEDKSWKNVIVSKLDNKMEIEQQQQVSSSGMNDEMLLSRQPQGNEALMYNSINDADLENKTNENVKNESEEQLVDSNQQLDTSEIDTSKYSVSAEKIDITEIESKVEDSAMSEETSTSDTTGQFFSTDLSLDKNAIKLDEIRDQPLLETGKINEHLSSEIRIVENAHQITFESQEEVAEHVREKESFVEEMDFQRSAKGFNENSGGIAYNLVDKSYHSYFKDDVDKIKDSHLKEADGEITVGYCEDEPAEKVKACDVSGQAGDDMYGVETGKKDAKIGEEKQKYMCGAEYDNSNIPYVYDYSQEGYLGDEKHEVENVHGVKDKVSEVEGGNQDNKRDEVKGGYLGNEMVDEMRRVEDGSKDGDEVEEIVDHVSGCEGDAIISTDGNKYDFSGYEMADDTPWVEDDNIHACLGDDANSKDDLVCDEIVDDTSKFEDDNSHDYLGDEGSGKEDLVDDEVADGMSRVEDDTSHGYLGDKDNNKVDLIDDEIAEGKCRVENDNSHGYLGEGGNIKNDLIDDDEIVDGTSRDEDISKVEDNNMNSFMGDEMIGDISRVEDGEKDESVGDEVMEGVHGVEDDNKNESLGDEMIKDIHFIEDGINDGYVGDRTVDIIDGVDHKDKFKYYEDISSSEEDGTDIKFDEETNKLGDKEDELESNISKDGVEKNYAVCENIEKDGTELNKENNHKITEKCHSVLDENKFALSFEQDGAGEGSSIVVQEEDLELSTGGVEKYEITNLDISVDQGTIFTLREEHIKDDKEDSVTDRESSKILVEKTKSDENVLNLPALENEDILSDENKPCEKLESNLMDVSEENQVIDVENTAGMETSESMDSNFKGISDKNEELDNSEEQNLLPDSEEVDLRSPPVLIDITQEEMCSDTHSADNEKDGYESPPLLQVECANDTLEKSDATKDTESAPVIIIEDEVGRSDDEITQTNTNREQLKEDIANAIADTFKDRLDIIQAVVSSNGNDISVMEDQVGNGNLKVNTESMDPLEVETSDTGHTEIAPVTTSEGEVDRTDDKITQMNSDREQLKSLSYDKVKEFIGEKTLTSDTKEIFKERHTLPKESQDDGNAQSNFWQCLELEHVDRKNHPVSNGNMHNKGQTSKPLCTESSLNTCSGNSVDKATAKSSSNIGLQELKQLFQFITSASNIKSERDDELEKGSTEEEGQTGDTNLFCQLCDENFDDTESFDIHMQGHDGTKENGSESETENTEGISKSECEEENVERKNLPANCVPFLYLMQKWLSQELDVEEEVDSLYSIDDRAELIRDIYQKCSYEQKNRLVSELSAIPTQLLTLSFDPSHSVSGLLPNIDCEMGCCQEEDMRLKAFIDYALYPSLLVEHLEIQKTHQHHIFPLMLDHHDHSHEHERKYLGEGVELDEKDGMDHYESRQLNTDDVNVNGHCGTEKQDDSDEDSENESLLKLSQRLKENKKIQKRKKGDEIDEGYSDQLNKKKKLKKGKVEDSKKKKEKGKNKKKKTLKIKIKINKKVKECEKETNEIGKESGLKKSKKRKKVSIQSSNGDSSQISKESSENGISSDKDSASMQDAEQTSACKGKKRKKKDEKDEINEDNMHQDTDKNKSEKKTKKRKIKTGEQGETVLDENSENTAEKRKKKQNKDSTDENSEKKKSTKLKTRGTHISKKMQKKLEKSKSITAAKLLIEENLEKARPVLQISSTKSNLQRQANVLADFERPSAVPTGVQNSSRTDPESDIEHIQTLGVSDENQHVQDQNVRNCKNKQFAVDKLDDISVVNEKPIERETFQSHIDHINSASAVPDKNLTVQNPEFKKCDTCEMMFFKSEHYHKHITKMHTAPTVHKCEKCGIECLGPRSLEAHMNTHKYEFRYRNESKHKCHRCNIGFPTRALKDRHLLIHKM